MENTDRKESDMLDGKNRDLILRAIGMLEGAAWMAPTESCLGEMLDNIADMLREVIEMEEKQ